MHSIICFLLVLLLAMLLMFMNYVEKDKATRIFFTIVFVIGMTIIGLSGVLNII